MVMTRSAFVDIVADAAAMILGRTPRLERRGDLSQPSKQAHNHLAKLYEQLFAE